MGSAGEELALLQLHPLQERSTREAQQRLPKGIYTRQLCDYTPCIYTKAFLQQPGRVDAHECTLVQHKRIIMLKTEDSLGADLNIYTKEVGPWGCRRLQCFSVVMG